jgi:hypothetical protein
MSAEGKKEDQPELRKEKKQLIATVSRKIRDGPTPPL